MCSLCSHYLNNVAAGCTTTVNSELSTDKRTAQRASMALFSVQISSKGNHSISTHNLKDINNKLPLKENLTINNKATIAVIRKKILNSKKFISKGIVNDNP